MKIDLPTTGAGTGGTMWPRPAVSHLWCEPAKARSTNHVHVGYVALTGLIGAILAFALAAACIANEHARAEASDAGHWVRTANSVDFVYGAK